jgi:hypothetical protein
VEVWGLLNLVFVDKTIKPLKFVNGTLNEYVNTYLARITDIITPKFTDPKSL